MLEPCELVQEKTWKSVFEREEGVAVQYLVMGGFRHFCCSSHQDNEGATACGNESSAFLVASGVHAGAGQQTFGWNSMQRSDLLMAFRNSDDVESPTTLHFHNHHEAGVHYRGHQENCPRRINVGVDNDAGCVPGLLSERLDSYRRGLADCFTRASGGRAFFFYSVTTTCDLMHGTDRAPRVPSTLPSSASKVRKQKSSVNWHSTALEACLLEHTEDFVFWDRTHQPVVRIDDRFMRDVAAGRITGFVTLKGGRETKRDSSVPFDAAGRFGFCVQRYAPRADQLSEVTLEQVRQVERFRSRGEAEAFADKQEPRTLTSGTFHSWETVSTSYLRWLMEARGFRNFRVRHLILYKFSDYPRHFLQPLLQRRHDAKRAGNNVAAECLKLLGNGSYGYNGLESTNYNSVRLVTHERLLDMRRRGMAHLTLQSITLVGLVRVKIKFRRLTKRDAANVAAASHVRRQRLRRQAAEDFFSLEAAVNDDDDEDDGEALLSFRTEEQEQRAVLGLEDDEDSDDDDDDDSDHNDGQQQQQRGDDSQNSFLTGVCTDEAVRLQDETALACKPNERLHLTALYAVEVSGKNRRLFNNLPKAVAVLSNSKRLFFGHLNTMLECLDPRLAELCYIDTDSCVWSLTFENLEDCVLKSKLADWKAASVLADEASPVSCHGKLKLEGTYRAGLFKTTKIYRLFGDLQYTRCKGVNRRAAVRLDNEMFDPDWTGAAVVHKTSLRPTKTGEIVIARESRHLAKPYNFKRYVVPGGVHTLPFSDPVVAAQSLQLRRDGGDDDDDDDDEATQN